MKTEKPKVIWVRFHVGITVAGQTLNTLEAAKHRADIELTPSGLTFSLPDLKKEIHHYFVPYTNIQFIKLDVNDASKAKKTA